MRNGFKKWDRKITGVKDDNVSTKEGTRGWIGTRGGALAYLYAYWKGHVCWGTVLECIGWDDLSSAERVAWYSCIGQNFGGDTTAGQVGLHNSRRYWDREAGESVSFNTLRKRQARRASASLAASA